MSRKQNSLMRFSRTERLAQLSEQEIVIEQKKREIQARIEAQRKNQREEVVKLEGRKETKPNKPNFSVSFYKEKHHKEETFKEKEKTKSLKNAFSNDGSFLDQFKKLSQSGLVHTNLKVDQKGQVMTKEDSMPSKKIPKESLWSVGCSDNQQNIKEAAKPHLDAVSMKFKNNTVKRLELLSNPLNDDDDDDEDDNDDNGSNRPCSQSLSKRKYEVSKQEVSIGEQPCHSYQVQTEESLSSTFSFDKGKLMSHDGNLSHLAEMVAKYGDEFEVTFKKQNENNPAFRFLFNDNSNDYSHFRNLVSMLRQSTLMERKSKSGSFAEQILNSNNGEENRCLMKDSNNRNNEKKQSPSSSKMAKESKMVEKYSDDYQADSEEEKKCYKMQKEKSEKGVTALSNKILEPSDEIKHDENESTSKERQKRKRKSRWGDAVSSTSDIQPPCLVTNLNLQSLEKLPTPKTNLLSQLTRSDPGLIQYAKQTFGSTNLSEEDWKKVEDHYKINLLYQDLVKKRAEINKLEKAGKFKYEYDSDEDVEGGTWEHKLRQQEMLATQLWAEELTRQAAGKHHIGDFLPPEELEKFMERYNAVKEGREPDLSDYKEYKLKEDNVGYRLLQKMGWNEGQGLGQDGSGITNPVNKATTRHENQGLGVERPDGLEPGDDEYDAYRKRMMLAYRFRPNPLNNPRRPYY